MALFPSAHPTRESNGTCTFPVSVHNGTDTHRPVCQDRYTPGRSGCGAHHMLSIVGIVIGLIAVVIILRMRVPGGVNSDSLGWMSEQWLAEHRASHSL